ncbi:MAG: flagellar transcriptional regulator FlhD, partial [Betaproteobacteria bacterium]|nr:flagellar transcriptional regulator FlhD [Betaproteobacteria bacterium]
MKAQVKAEIREANMAYLNMAQSLIRHDLKSAVKILGMSEDAAEIIKTLSESQKASIADS